MSPELQENPRSFLDQLIHKLANLRFVTISLVFHVFIVIVVGTAVISKIEPHVPDFTAASGSMIAESTDIKPPEEKPQLPDTQNFTAAPTVTAPTQVSAILSTSTSPTNFKMTAPTKQAGGPTDSMNDAVGKALGAAGDGMPGRTGGTRTGMIFNKKVEATNLGVILDVSGSAHPHLATAIEEIQKGFSDAIIVLYPGCGMVEVRGRRQHSVRAMTDIKDTDLGPDAAPRSTAGQLAKAMKVPAFHQLMHTRIVREKVWVSWYEPDSDGKTDYLISQTHEAFNELVKRGVDTIYWFADFKDRVDPETQEDLLRHLKAKKVKVYAHNFADAVFPPQVTELVEKTGGTKDSVKAAK